MRERIGHEPASLQRLKSAAEDAKKAVSTTDTARIHLVLSQDKPGRGQQLTIDPAAAEILKSYRWPGNVRQLQDVIRQACADCEGETLTVESLPSFVRQK